MAQPIILPAAAAELYEQVADALTGDTDPTYGLLAALGAGAASIFPNFDTPGPSNDRSACPTPFLFCVDGGVRALNRQSREYRVHIEAHDDMEMGRERLKGIVERLKLVLVKQEWRPTPQPPYFRPASGLQLESVSPLLPDERFLTNLVMLTLVLSAGDQTSNRGMGNMAGPNALSSGD